MQCSSCTFENLPGARLCARCGSRLDLDGVTVEPPRASRHNAATAVRRTAYRLRSQCPDFAAVWAGLKRLHPEPLDGRALAWSFIPGLGHLKTGRRFWGRVLLPAWLGFFALMVLSLGTGWTQYMLVAMISVHTLAIVTLFAAGLAFEGFFMRAAFGLLVFLAFNFFLYDPCVWLCSRFLVIVPIAHSPGGDVIQAGDGLLCEGPWLRPESFARGNIVLYRIEGRAADGVLIRAGHGVNRVVGGPGDRVTRENGVLTVNGAEPEERCAPLGRPVAIGDFDVALHPHQYAVFTTVERRAYGLHRANPLESRAVTRHLSVVTYDDILGRVIVRLRPFSRFGSIG